MFEPSSLIWFVPGLPLLAAIVTVLLGFPATRKLSHLPIALALPLSCACAITLMTHVGHPDKVIHSASLLWFQGGDIEVSLRLGVDALTAVMLIVITFVGSLIAFFSIFYMKGDPGYTRYFALMALFVFSMCLLVLGENMLVMFAGWEGVGLCSYMLVGYWYAKPSAAAAARKAFLVTRLGDVGLLLGIFMLWRLTGFNLEFEAMFNQLAAVKDTHHAEIVTACLLLFCGAVGKSAQFPLYVWLPDAMEGPTPVSALIHAATMVTAGVYLLARCTPLFILAPDAQLVVAIIGVVTAFMAAYIALSQYDLKRVLAYSTVSQLGFMFFALGCGVGSIAEFAVIAAIFHLFTHAFFKAVLFLSAGSVMHAMGDVIDMRKFSGLRKVLPVTHIAFLCGAAALAGVPLLSGFWSKEEIFGSGLLAAETAPAYRTTYGALLAVAILTAGMTAFYTFRAYFKTFWGELHVPESAHVGHAHHHGSDDHAHHTEHANPEPLVMKVPLLVLALGSLVIGGLLQPVTHWFGHFLEQSPAFETAATLSGVTFAGHESNFTLMIASIAVALTGVFIAYGMFGKSSSLPERVERQAGIFASYSHNRLYMDDLYAFLFVRPGELLAWFSYQFDRIIDGIGRLFSSIPQFVGKLLQPIQIGLVQFYALAMVTGLVGFLCFLVLSTGK